MTSLVTRGNIMIKLSIIKQHDTLLTQWLLLSHLRIFMILLTNSWEAQRSSILFNVKILIHSNVSFIQVLVLWCITFISPKVLLHEVLSYFLDLLSFSSYLFNQALINCLSCDMHISFLIWQSCLAETALLYQVFSLSKVQSCSSSSSLTAKRASSSLVIKASFPHLISLVTVLLIFWRPRRMPSGSSWWSALFCWSHMLQETSQSFSINAVVHLLGVSLEPFLCSTSSKILYQDTCMY